MKTLFINNNNNPCHYEILETFIIKYKELFKITENLEIYLYFKTDNTNTDFVKYIKDKYKNIKLEIPKHFNYYICTTIYDRDFNNIKKNTNYIYISHEITDRLKALSNVYFLSPLQNVKNYIYCDILPFNTIKQKTDIPYYYIQGNIHPFRRNYNLLEKILSKTYKYDFKFVMLGRGSLPEKLKKYKDKIIVKSNLSFTNYHKEFTKCYCILPLITKNTHPHYYKNKLTSTINYTKAYNLLCLIDKDLQDIYKLNNVELFNNENDICEVFEKTLLSFYNKV